MYTSPSKKSYIGQTKYEEKRKSNHRRNTQKLDTSFGRALKKYGYENFEYKVLFKAYFQDKERLTDMLNYMEMYFIKKYDTIKYGYNIMIGGNITEMPIETRQKISNTLKGRTFSDERKLNISNGRKGKLVSEETREKISNSMKGMKLSDQCREASIQARSVQISQFSKENIFIKDWDSAAAIERELKICNSNIIAVCKGKRLSAGNYIWKYK